jgi:hypothetical protein
MSDQKKFIRMFSFKEETFESYCANQLFCPVCGFNYIHIKELIKKPDLGRQGSTSLRMYCESGHNWDVDFIEHKGEIAVGISNISRSF